MRLNLSDSKTFLGGCNRQVKFSSIGGKTLTFTSIQSWNGCGLVAKSCLTLVTLRTVACQAPLSMGILQARIPEWVVISFSKGLSSSGIGPRAPALQTDSLPTEIRGKPKLEGTEGIPAKAE